MAKAHREERRYGQEEMETKRSLFKAAISVIALLTAMNLFPSHALADRTITIPPRVDGQVLVVANFTIPEGAKIAYSFNASDFVEFAVYGYEDVDQITTPLVFLFSVTNTSANGTFTAPFEGHTYQFTFRNQSTSSSVLVTYNFHEIKPPLSMVTLLFLVVIASAIIAFATIIFVTRLRKKREPN